jgi:undecaprenyl-diphosphatase
VIRSVAALDERVDAAFDRLRGQPVADRIMYGASEVGDFGLLWLFLGSLRGLRSDEDARAAVRLGVCLGAESALVNGVIKTLLPRARPVHDHEHPHRLRTPLTTSFPSGHASAGFMAATLLADGRPRRSWWYGLAAVVAASRIHVRIHHASDVVAGAALGVALGRLARRLWPLEAAQPPGGAAPPA